MELRGVLQVAFLAGAVALAACGKSKEAKLLEQLANECWGLHAAGATLNDAGNDFSYADYISGNPVGYPECVEMQPLSDTDPCGQGSATAITVCHVNFSYFPSDQGLCTVNGCVLGCEVRVMQTDLQANGAGAKVCNSLWFSGQPSPPFP